MAAGRATNVVFIGNLAWSTSEENLRVFASSVGPVLSVQIQAHADTGRSKGWGLIRYSSPEVAARAIEVLNGQELDNRKLHVREDRSHLDSAEGVVVFVGNLPWSVTSESLTDLFKEYDPVDVHVKTNMAGRSRGFALVKFTDTEVADLAIANLNGYELEGRLIQVRFDRQQGEGGEGGAGADANGGGVGGLTDRVTVTNLAWTTEEAELVALLSKAGTVVNVEIQRHADSGRSKGWAIATFGSRDEALNAINTLNKTVLRERSISMKFYSTTGGRRN
ncbi:rna binding protein [Nannochloropsis oceanica]